METLPESHDREKSKYAEWPEENLAAAMADITYRKMTYGKAAKKWNIPKTTLYNHIKGKNKYANDDRKLLGRQPVFPKVVENGLVAYITEFADNLFGLTCKDVRKLAFQVAQKNNFHHNFDKELKMAGEKWLRGFMRRYPEMSILTPEKLSYARITGFTQEAVDTFYAVLARICHESLIDSTRVYNMDETGFSTVVKKAPKVVARKGSKHLSTPAAGERGVNTTAVCCVSASGIWVPPMIIFKGKNITPEHGIGISAGGIIAGSDWGYINQELFVVWLEHFIDFVKPTPAKKVLLVLDGHTSHTKNIEALDMANDNGVILLQLPAHCTHRMQPLDVAFFFPLGKAYANQVQVWQAKNPGIKMTSLQFCQNFSVAYEEKAGIKVAKNAFEASGIWPINKHVFKTTDFARLCGPQTPAPEPIRDVVLCDAELSVTLSEILPLPVIAKPEKVATQVMELTKPIYITGLKAKLQAKKDKIQALKDAKEKRIENKKAKDLMRENSRKEKEDNKKIKQAAKAIDLARRQLEAAEAKEERRRSQQQKTGRGGAKKKQSLFPVAVDPADEKAHVVKIPLDQQQENPEMAVDVAPEPARKKMKVPARATQEVTRTKKSQALRYAGGEQSDSKTHVMKIPMDQQQENPEIVVDVAPEPARKKMKVPARATQEVTRIKKSKAPRYAGGEQNDSKAHILKVPPDQKQVTHKKKSKAPRYAGAEQSDSHTHVLKKIPAQQQENPEMAIVKEIKPSHRILRARNLNHPIFVEG